MADTDSVDSTDLVWREIVFCADDAKMPVLETPMYSLVTPMLSVPCELIRYLFNLLFYVTKDHYRYQGALLNYTEENAIQ